VQPKPNGGGATTNAQTANNLYLAGQLPTSANSKNITGNSQNQIVGATDKLTKHAKDDTLMSYAQLLKQECQYEGAPKADYLIYKPSRDQQNLQATNLPAETLKHQLQTFTSEMLRKVLARSESMNQLR